MLEEWFGSPVVLTSSGRGALMLAFGQLGLNRYRNRIAMSPMISTCVVEAVAYHAFPVDAAAAGEFDATLVYHQYGFMQAVSLAGRVVEDICHSFYAAPTTGRRVWLGEFAVFSLPKFFSTSSPVGGLIVHDRNQAEGLRSRRDSNPQRSIQQQDEESHIFRDWGEFSELAKAELYLSRLLNPRVSDSELGGLPNHVSDIASEGRRRSEIIELYCDAAGDHSCPDGWHEMMREHPPYAFPVGGKEAQLLDVRSRLHEMGVETDIYSIDIARNMRSPKFGRMLLLPCHGAVPPAVVTEIASILRELGACRSVMA